MTDSILKRPLFFACSIAFAVSFVCSFIGINGMLAVSGALVFAFLFILPFKTPLKKTALLSLIICLAVIASSAFFYLFRYLPATHYASKQVSITGDVIAVDDTSARISVKSIADTDGGAGEKVNFNAQVELSEDHGLVPSARVTMDVRFYNTAYRNATRGNVLYGTVQSDVEVLSKKNVYSLRYILFAIRSNIENAMPFETADTHAFIKGMLLGDDSDIPGVFLNKFDTVGLSHIMSVSGMHLTFSVILFDFIMSLFAIGYKPRAVMALVSVLAFTLISGVSVACVRAAIMLAVYYVGRLYDRIADGLTSLSFAAVLILLLAPYNIGSLSFLLSLSATFGLIFLAPFLNSLIRFDFRNRFVSAVFYTLTRLFTLSLGATLACLPIIVYYFGQVCVISPLVNMLLAIPIQLLFYIGCIGIIFSFIPFLRTAFSLVADALYDFIEYCIGKLYNIENITLSVGYDNFYFVLALLAVLVVGIYFLYKKLPSVRLVYCYIGGYALLCILLFTVNIISSYGKVTVSFADVGHGNASVITYDESAVLIDCGGDDIGELQNVFRDNSVKSVSLIALTHADADHMGFVTRVLDTYEVDEIMYPAFADEQKLQDIILKAKECGTKLTVVQSDTERQLFKGTTLSVMVDKAFETSITNNLSAVYRLDVFESSVLFTGDMNIYQEYNYLSYGNKLDCDVLCVAHHGSITSTHNGFIKACSPSYSVISAPANDSKMPNERVITGLTDQGSDVLLTSELSTVTFQFSNKGYKCLNEH